MAKFDLALMTMEMRVRFWAKVKVGEPGECWPWQAATNQKRMGYGVWCPVRGTTYRAHRVAAYMVYGASDLIVLHSCDNPPCCNPNHLRYGDHAENANETVQRGRHVARHGEDSFTAKLKEHQISEIRASKASAVSIAEKYGVSDMTIFRIRSGRTWRRVPA